MGTTADKLAKLAETKEAIRTAIENKGVAVADSEPFSAYPERINSISSGGVGKSMLNINITLDGAVNAITEGATITITNNATGEVVERVWEGSTIQIVVESLSEYSIKCSKITNYSSPKKVTFIPANGVSYDYTFDYITPPLGVYLLNTDDELIAPDDWKTSYECVGVYVGYGESTILPYKSYVLAPEVISITDYAVNTEPRYNMIRKGMANAATAEYGGALFNQNNAGLSNTKYMVDNYSGTFAEAWNYRFRHGAQGFVPSAYEIREIIARNKTALLAAYGKLGVDIPYTITYSDINDWMVSMIQSSTPASIAIEGLSISSYGWVYADSIVGNDATTTIPFSAY